MGRLYVAYPFLGAMQEPVVRDKRARGILPRLFCFHNVECVNDGQQGSAGQAPLCVLLSLRLISNHL